MAERFDPYRKWLGIPPSEQPPNLYRLLGLSNFESDPDVIATAADARMVHLKTFQHGPHSELSQKLLNEVSAAQLCLLDRARKAQYDRELRQQLDSRFPRIAHPPPVPPPGPGVKAPPPPPPEPRREPPPQMPVEGRIPVANASPVTEYVYTRKRKAKLLRVLVVLALLAAVAAGFYFYVWDRIWPPPAPDGAAPPGKGAKNQSLCVLPSSALWAPPSSAERPQHSEPPPQ